jgi:hypothetical protein
MRNTFSKKSFFFYFGLIAMLSNQLFAETYYVATDGNDSNSGTEDMPWKTMQKAATTAEAGDQVYIKAGTYYNDVYFSNSGDSTAWIKFDAYHGDEHKAILEGGRIGINQKSYIRISGIRVQNSAIGFKVIGPCSNITLHNNYTYNTWSSGIAVWGVDWKNDPGEFNNVQDVEVTNNKIEHACNGGWNECITLANGVVGFKIENNEIFNGADPINGGEGIDVKEGCSNGIIANNYIHGLTRRGIYIDGGGILKQFGTPECTDIEIYNNVVDNCNNGSLAIMTEGKGNVRDILIYNNLFINGQTVGDAIMFYKHPNGSGRLSDIVVVNNVCYNHTRNGILLNDPTSSGMIFRNNICYKNDGQDFNMQTGSYVSSNNLIGVNPLFVDESANDFRLQDNSPAIDAGTFTDAPALDFDGNSRIGNVDIGAFESDAGNEMGTGSPISNYEENIVFPNPFHSDLIIKLRGKKYTDVSLFDISGRGVLFKKIGPDENEVSLSMADNMISSGIYFVHLRGLKHFETIKVKKVQ